MGRVIAVGPGGQAQAPVRDDRARGVIEFVAGAGLIGQLLLSPPCDDQAAAAELRRALYRSARYWCSCGRRNCTRRHPNFSQAGELLHCPRSGQRLGCRAEVVLDAEKKYRVQFSLFDKHEALREVISRYGPDPNSWPYWSRRKKLREDD